MKVKEKHKVRFLHIFFRLLPKVYSASPGRYILLMCINILHGISFGIITMKTQHFFESATDLIDKKGSLSSLLTTFAILGLAYVFSQILNGIDNYLLEDYQIRAIGCLSREFHDKISRIDPVRFENNTDLDIMTNALAGITSAVKFVRGITSISTFYIAYCAFMAVYLFSIKPILVIALLIIFIPVAFAQFIRAKVFSKMEDLSAPVRRENNYYEECIVNRDYFAETRQLGVYSFFKTKFTASLKQLNKLVLSANTKSNSVEFALKLLNAAGYLVVLYMLFSSLLSQDISVGAFAAVFGSINFIFSIMNEIVSMHIGNMANNLGTTLHYLRFMDSPERGGSDEKLPMQADIEVKNVSFSYPDRDKSDRPKAIDSVSFNIKAGETIAIVGRNGSGKSTLVHLLAGLYLANEGDICAGDVSYRDISMHCLFEKTSAVFQNYQRYKMTLRENICISRMEENVPDEKLDKVCMDSGFQADGKESRIDYNTMLSREFDGIDLSGGQWQRIAIARGLYRSGMMIFLDEPTAMIDPLDETEIYNRFGRLVKGNTAIIVTHRLGSVRFADRILVMKDGQLCGIGNHEELMQNCDEYAELYNSQKQWYV